MLLPFKNPGREKSGKAISSCIDIASLKTFMRNGIGKTHKVKKSAILYLNRLLFRSRLPLNLAILCESIIRFNLQDHSLNL
jgi:hypothetical protein